MINTLRFHLATRIYYFRQLLTRDGEWELRLLRRYVAANQLAIDVGANNGVYTYHLSRIAEKVIAFEPNPTFSRFLNNMPRNVSVEQIALSDNCGSGTLSIPFGTHGDATGWATLEEMQGASKALPVQIRTLDSYNLRPGFIKIDVEGHEHSVLSGAEHTIRSHKPILLIELENRHRANAVQEACRMLDHWGYDGFFYIDGKPVSIGDFSPDEHQPHIDIAPGQIFRRQDFRYFNNFLFLPR